MTKPPKLLKKEMSLHDFGGPGRPRPHSACLVSTFLSFGVAVWVLGMWRVLQGERNSQCFGLSALLRLMI